MTGENTEVDMSNAKHTPGPWHAGEIRINGADERFDGCDISAGNGANVALAIHQSSDRAQGETIANARLIASAPELLAALEEIANGDMDGALARCVARAAIAKARGA